MKHPFYLLIFLPMMMFSQSDFEKAEKFFQDEKYEQAHFAFKTILKKNPTDLKTIEYLGDIAGHNKSWNEAVAYYKTLKELKPSEADFYYKYGGVLGMKAKEANKLKALGMIDEVKASFLKAISLNPKHIEARWALIEFYIQLPGIIGGSESKAIKYSNELLQLSAVDGHLSRGHIEEYFKRYESAEKQYIKAISISDSKTCYNKLASLYKNKMRKPEKAKAVIESYNEKKIKVRF